MQDAYVGDIGDYGKYGLFRALARQRLSLGVNWYAVVPRKSGKQKDGKFIQYLQSPEKYRHYDPELFDALERVVHGEKNRTLERVETLDLFPAVFYSDPLSKMREDWHRRALEKLASVDLVFLDPDNGLETERMRLDGKATGKHVRVKELTDYYYRGQSVVLYQHRPQMTSKDQCVQSVLDMQRQHIRADQIQLLEFPRYTNRFYFFFLHEKHADAAEAACRYMTEYWAGLCCGIQI